MRPQRGQVDGRHTIGKDYQYAPLPPKMPRRHRWMVVCNYTVGEAQAARIHGVKNGAEARLDEGNLLAVMVGCVDCEKPWSPAAVDKGCSAPAYPWNEQLGGLQ